MNYLKISIFYLSIVGLTHAAPTEVNNPPSTPTSSPAPQEIKSKPVWLAPHTTSKKVSINGMDLIIRRNQDRSNLVAKIYQKTARGTIKPMRPFMPHPVETISEHEMIQYISRLDSSTHSVAIVDARSHIWLTLTGQIPGSVHVPFNRFNNHEDYALDVLEDLFGVTILQNGSLDFSNSKTLAIYCNGNWCKMSPELIWKLLEYGYPATKIKYYRGGMQAWQLLGLTTVD